MDQDWVSKEEKKKEKKMLLSCLTILENRLDYIDETNNSKEKIERLAAIKYILKLVKDTTNVKICIIQNLDKIFKMIEINIFEHAIDWSRYKSYFMQNQVCFFFPLLCIK